jgi:polysaccharide biosynthesis transport protein
MNQTPVPPQCAVEEPEYQVAIHTLQQTVLRILLAVRYQKALVIAAMLTAALLGGLYFMTAPRRYEATARLLITQTGRDRLDTSITNEEAQRYNAMPTFENLVVSDKVVEAAVARLAPADRVDLPDGCRDGGVGCIQAHLSAKATRPTSILNVTYNSKDPRAAASVVRAVVQSFLDVMDRMHKGTADELNSILTKEREEVAAQLATKQAELLQCRRHFADMGFRSDGKVLHPTMQRAVYFNDAYVAAQRQRVEHKALLDGMESALQSGQNPEAYVAAVGEVVGREFLADSLGLGGQGLNSTNSVDQELRSASVELEAAQQHFGPMHPVVVALTERVRLAQESMGYKRQRDAEQHSQQLGPWLVQLMRQKVDEAQKRENNLKTHFENSRTEAISLSGQLAQIEMLERDIKRLNDMDGVLVEQLASLDLKHNKQEVRVAVIAEPKVNASPVWPNLHLVILLTALAGLGTALGLVILLDALDDRFRSVEEIQSRLGLRLLAMIRQLHVAAETGLDALVTHATPASVDSECFRTLRTALTLTYPNLRQLVVTSTEPGDGKTTTLANLAVCYAQAEKRVLLVDADLRRHGLTTLLEMQSAHGLSELLRGDDNVSQTAASSVRHSGIEGLDVLYSGRPTFDPAKLLSGPRFAQLLAWAEPLYDVVLIDSPPLLAAADTAVIGRAVDGVMVLVRPARNRRRLVARVVERLAQLQIPILGAVVNHTGSSEEQAYYGYRGYGYGYGYAYGYSQRYGYGESDASPDESPDAASAPLESEEDREEDAASASRLRVPLRRVA